MKTLAGLVAAIAFLGLGVNSAGASSIGSHLGVTHFEGGSSSLVAGIGTSTPLVAPFPEVYRGDRITVGVLAYGRSDSEGTGMFSVTHRTAEGTLLADLRGEIDCLRFEGNYAVMTGVVTFANTPGLPNDELKVGTVTGIVIEDAGDSDTMVWAFSDTGGSCKDIPTKTLVGVETGQFVVMP